MKVERARNEAADQGALGLEGAVPGRGQVHGADARLKIQDRKRPRVDAAIPAHDIERIVLVHEALPLDPALDPDFTEPFVRSFAEWTRRVCKRKTGSAHVPIS
jgi:hypothetical protein